MCKNVLVIQEGGYNLDFIGQHASGVARALINGPYSDKSQAIVKTEQATPCDLEIGVKSLSDINSAECVDWALKNI